MGGLWQGLLANVAVVAVVVSVWTNLRASLAARGRSVEALGLAGFMGVGSLLATTLAAPLSPGLCFDLQATPLALAGFFGSPLAAAVATVPALVYRVWLGGQGAPSGCLGILLCAAVPALLRRVVAGRLTRASDIVVLAVATAVTHLLCRMALPSAALLPAAARAAAPAALDLAAIMLAGFSVLREERRRGLVRSNALHRAIVDALPDSITVRDLDGHFIAANPATARMMGVASVADLIGRTDLDILPADVARRFRADERRAPRDGQDGHDGIIERQVAFADGRQRWLSTLTVPLRDARGRYIGLITHDRDVTATRLMADELQATRQHLADALAQMADGLVMYDADDTTIVCNEQYRALFPLTADARVPGTKLADLLRRAIERGEEDLPEGVDLESWVEATVARAKVGGERVFVLADGRSIETRTRPLASGAYLTVFSDVTIRKTLEETLRYRAEHDPLTGLANRAVFDARLRQAHARASAGGEFAVMLVDLDRFKAVNDSFGHQVGDDLLVEVARRLRDVCRRDDLVARLGGDEFAIVSEGALREPGMARLAEGVLDAVTRPFRVGGVTLAPGCSIGCTLFPDDPGDPDSLVAHADRALYAAKSAGRRRWAVYAEERPLAAAG